MSVPPFAINLAIDPATRPDSDKDTPYLRTSPGMDERWELEAFQA